MREEEGDIIDALRLLIYYQRPIVTSQRDERLVGGHEIIAYRAYWTNKAYMTYRAYRTYKTYMTYRSYRPYLKIRTGLPGRCRPRGWAS